MYSRGFFETPEIGNNAMHCHQKLYYVKTKNVINKMLPL